MRKGTFSISCFIFFHCNPTTQPNQSYFSITLFQAKTNTSNIEPGSSISVPFTVAQTTNGVVNTSASGTFTVKATNDRSYNSSSPSSVTITAGGTANGTVTLTVPETAASGTDVTLTIEAQNAATTDINYALLRFSVSAKVLEPEGRKHFSIKNN